MAADYRHIGGLENRLGRHYSRFFAFWPARPLQVNHLPCENCAMLGRIGEVGLGATPLFTSAAAAIEFAEKALKRHRSVWLSESGVYRNRGGKRLTSWIYYSP
jgi:hypothetical protein